MNVVLPAWIRHRSLVGVAELAVTNNPLLTLGTYSLGSCVGVAVYDPVARIAGLLHAMLPAASLDPEKARRQPGMFLDTGLPALFEMAVRLGAELRRARLFVAGGAQVVEACSRFNIGAANCAMLHRLLADHPVTLRRAELGGTSIRTLHLNTTGEVRLKTNGDRERIFSLA